MCLNGAMSSGCNSIPGRVMNKQAGDQPWSFPLVRTTNESAWPSSAPSPHASRVILSRFYCLQEGKWKVASLPTRSRVSTGAFVMQPASLLFRLKFSMRPSPESFLFSIQARFANMAINPMIPGVTTGQKPPNHLGCHCVVLERRHRFLGTRPFVALRDDVLRGINEFAWRDASRSK